MDHFRLLKFTFVIHSPRYSPVTVARHRLNIPCPFTALFFFPFFLNFCFCYWCVCVRVMMFTFYITSTSYMYSPFVFVINSYGSSRVVVFYIHLSWILGDWRFLLLLLCFFPYAFNKWNQISLFEYIKVNWLLVQDNGNVFISCKLEFSMRYYVSHVACSMVLIQLREIFCLFSSVWMI